MMQLQLRTPQNMKIQDLVSQMASVVIESVQRELDSNEVPFDSYRVMEAPMAAALSPYLKAFDHCGQHIVCTEGIEGKLWPDITDRIYILVLPEGPESFVENLCRKVLESVLPFLDTEEADALDRRVKSSLQRTLSRHIYWNPACGNHEVCKLSSPINPWS